MPSDFNDPLKFIVNSNVKKGLQYQQNFIVTVNKPKLDFPSELATIELTWNAMEVSCPGISLGVNGSNINGRLMYVAGERSDQDLSITFLEDASLSCRRFFENWMRLIYDPFNKTRDYPSNYQSDHISVASTNPTGKIEFKDIFVDVFPFQISDINYNKSGNEVTKTAVSFKFRTHVLKGPKDDDSITNRIE